MSFVLGSARQPECGSNVEPALVTTLIVWASPSAHGNGNPIHALAPREWHGGSLRELPIGIVNLDLGNRDRFGPTCANQYADAV